MTARTQSAAVDTAGSVGASLADGRAAGAKPEADRRLQEAEERFRDAVEELRRIHSTKNTETLFQSGRHPLCQHGDSCVANAVGSLCQSFLLAYGVRVGIGVLLRAFKLARKRPYHSFLDLKVLFHFYVAVGELLAFWLPLSFSHSAQEPWPDECRRICICSCFCRRTI